MRFFFWFRNMRYFKITQMVVGGEVEGANTSLRSAIKLVSFISDNCQQNEPDHQSILINIKSKGTFSSKKEPIGKVWYIAGKCAYHLNVFVHFLAALAAL